jgi:ribosomal protein L11 methyltransferase
MMPDSFYPGKLDDISVVKQHIIGQVYTNNRTHRAIQICSGPGFGSVEHPTTRSCLKCLRGLPDQFSPENVLDAGTGNAILAIAAVFQGAEKVTAVDIQAEALNTAKRNVVLNGVQNRVWLCCADVFLLRGWYDLIIANLNPGSFEHMDSFLKAHLIEGGYSLVSGLSGFERDRVLRRLVIDGSFIVHDELWDSGWTTFLFHKA